MQREGACEVLKGSCGKPRWVLLSERVRLHVCVKLVQTVVSVPAATHGFH